MHVGARYGVHNLGASVVRPLVLRCAARLTSGKQSEPNDSALANPTGEPIEVHELKFYMKPVLEALTDIGRVSGGLLSVALWVDKHPITDGFVPVWLLSPAYALDLERISPGWSFAAGSLTNRMVNVTRREDAFYSWKLDHPLYVGPKSGLSVAFQHTGLDTAVMDAGVSVCARVLPGAAKPGNIRVPWVSAWSSKMFEAFETGDDLSPTTALKNPFGQDIQVERFVGRINQLAQFVGRFEPGTGSQQASVADEVNGAFERTMSVKHYDSVGNLIVPAYTKFRNVYGYRARAWMTRFKMPAETYHRVALRKSAQAAGVVYPTGIAASNFVQAQAQAQVSLVGWRKEAA
ncbi:MAG: hypothetical protein KA310_03460 [Pseudomonadales bacterium]|nr:hypothetical protein [Pseudomonadales bacterium]